MLYFKCPESGILIKNILFSISGYVALLKSHCCIRLGPHYPYITDMYTDKTATHYFKWEHPHLSVEYAIRVHAAKSTGIHGDRDSWVSVHTLRIFQFAVIFSGCIIFILIMFDKDKFIEVMHSQPLVI